MNESIESSNVSDGNSTLVPSTSQSKNQNVDEISAVTGVEVAIVQRNPDRITRRPRELLVKVRLPGLDSAAGVDVQVDGAAKTVRVDHLGANLHAQATLPFPVEDDKGSATFDSDTSLLVLTLPVVAPKEEDKNALQHLENEDSQNDAPNSQDQNGVDQDHAMVEAQKLRGMALPRKLGNDMMF